MDVKGLAGMLAEKKAKDIHMANAGAANISLKWLEYFLDGKDKKIIS